ncbi:MAG: phosphoribosylformylglycinamidine synthase subunit PurS [Gemmatimonadota bacterium]
MSRFVVQVLITPRPGLLDPQGSAIHHALQQLDFPEVSTVRAGKALYLDVEASSPDQAEARVREMSKKLLANPVTEDFQVHVEDADVTTAAGGGK